MRGIGGVDVQRGTGRSHDCGVVCVYRGWNGGLVSFRLWCCSRSCRCRENESVRGPVRWTLETEILQPMGKNDPLSLATCDGKHDKIRSRLIRSTQYALTSFAPAPPPRFNVPTEIHDSAAFLCSFSADWIHMDIFLYQKPTLLPIATTSVSLRYIDASNNGLMLLYIRIYVRMSNLN